MSVPGHENSGLFEWVYIELRVKGWSFVVLPKNRNRAWLFQTTSSAQYFTGGNLAINFHHRHFADIAACCLSSERPSASLVP